MIRGIVNIRIYAKCPYCEYTYVCRVIHRKIVGENIRAARKEKGWTQETLAWSAKLNVSYLSAVESGKVNISLDTLATIAKTLDVPFEQLLRGLNWE